MVQGVLAGGKPLLIPVITVAQQCCHPRSCEHGATGQLSSPNYIHQEVTQHLLHASTRLGAPRGEVGLTAAQPSPAGGLSLENDEARQRNVVQETADQWASSHAVVWATMPGKPLQTTDSWGSSSPGDPQAGGLQAPPLRSTHWLTGQVEWKVCQVKGTGCSTHRVCLATWAQ